MSPLPLLTSAFWLKVFFFLNTQIYIYICKVEQILSASTTGAPAILIHPSSDITISIIRSSLVLVLYLSCLLGLAEERGLGCEESEVLALIIQAAVPTAHAVTAGHGGGQHCLDGHGEVRGQPPAPEQHQSSTLTA